MFFARKRSTPVVAALVMTVAFSSAPPEGAAAAELAFDMTAIHARQRARAADSEARQLSIVRERMANTRQLRAPGGNAEASLVRLHVKRRHGHDAESRLLDTRRIVAAEKLRRTPRLARWMGGKAVLSETRANDRRASAFSTKGLAFGADYRVSPRLLIGHATGLAYDRSPLATDMTYSTRILSQTLYGTLFTGDRTYLDVALGASRSSFSGWSSRGVRAPGGEGDRLFAMLRASRAFTLDRLKLRSYGEATFSHMRFSGAASGHRNEAAEMKLGLTGETRIETLRGRVTPRAGLEWSAARSERTAPGATQKVRRLEDSAKITARAGFDWALNPRATLTTDYGLSADTRGSGRKQTLKTRFTLRF